MSDIETQRGRHIPHTSDLREVKQDREGTPGLIPRGAIPLLAGGSVLTWVGVRGRSVVPFIFVSLGLGALWLGIQSFRSSSTSLLGRRKLKPSQAVKIEASVIVNRRQEDVFKFWRNFENFPLFMRHILKVEMLSPTRSRWIMNLPNIENIRGSSTVEWESEIINEKEYELIGWRSLVNTDVDHAGSVQFKPMDDGGVTEVRVTLQYSPLGGLIGAGIIKMLGEDPRVRLQEDLYQLKTLLETNIDRY